MSVDSSLALFHGSNTKTSHDHSETLTSHKAMCPLRFDTGKKQALPAIVDHKLVHTSLC